MEISILQKSFITYFNDKLYKKVYVLICYQIFMSVTFKPIAIDLGDFEY